MFRYKKTLFAFVLLLGVFLFSVNTSFATSGSIDTAEKYAWSSSAGWVNFGTTNGGVLVTDSALTGHAWSENYGWINLNPSQGGVFNNGTGNLSGYAWGENLGWIDFSAVTIDPDTGEFSGQATGDNVGTITFDCTNCAVKTDWRVVAETPSVGIIFPEITPPSGGNNFKVTINSGVENTTDRTVVLDLFGSDNVDYFWLAEDANLLDAQKISYNSNLNYNTISFTMAEGEGLKSVYVKFCTNWGYCSDIVTDSIFYHIPVEEPVEEDDEVVEEPSIPDVVSDKKDSEVLPDEGFLPEIIDIVEETVEDVKEYLAKIPLVELFFSEDVLENIKDQLVKLPIINSLLPYSVESIKDQLARLPIINSLLPYSVGNTILKFSWALPKFLPSKTSVAPSVSFEKMVSEKTPIVFGGAWRFLPTKRIQKFVFAPLPKDFTVLKENIPQIEKTFSDVGVNRFTDISKLKSIKLAMPGLNDIMKNLNSATLSPVELAQLKNIPLAQLPLNVKEKLPTDVVFTKVMGTSIDLGSNLVMSEQGKMVQKMVSISGKPLHLVIKPEHPVKNIKGYIVFNSREIQAKAGSGIPLASTFKSLFFSQPVLAYDQEKPVRVEEKLVMLEFEYTDPDNDGIYTADIETPIPAGEYEIITVLYFDDPEYGPKELRLITVVDPEGYVYEKVGGKELRISGAIVSLYRLNTDSMLYEEWSAGEYQQKNPQMTDIRGSYAFLVPEGTYYLGAIAPGYLDYEGKTFEVEEGRGVHLNIELKSKYWWSRVIDWRTTALIITIMMLSFNFYKDKRRDMSERRK